MRLIVQPRDGLTAVTSAIRLAIKEIDIAIFRCDWTEFEKLLQAAVRRGVRVRALIAHTNRGGERLLRKLEQNLLGAGATVARTGDELVRYHAKFMVIDRKALWVLGFNFTALDTTKTRSFGIVIKRQAEVQQALKLFDADSARVPYDGTSKNLVVSPDNARTLLAQFIQKARRQLLIYDPKVADPAMVKLLKDRAANGVDVRVIGKVAKAAQALPHEKYPGKRLHVRVIIRDGRDAFIGSQSLRKVELDNRREVGVLVSHAAIARELVSTFEEDWALTDSGRRRAAREARKENDRSASGRSRTGDELAASP